MNPREKKPKIIYRIIDRKTGEAQGSYSRAYYGEYNYGEENETRNKINK
jgi:hypothetical protein